MQHMPTVADSLKNTYRVQFQQLRQITLGLKALSLLRKVVNVGIACLNKGNFHFTQSVRTGLLGFGHGASLHKVP